MRYVIIIFYCFAISIGHTKQLALSFDDGLNPDKDARAEEINQEILNILNKNHIQAIIYPALIKTGQTEGLRLVQNWGIQGHQIGNHSAEHLNLNKPDVSLDQYLKSIQQEHAIFSKLQGFVPRYRFPFLKEGNTFEKRNGVRQWLDQNNYHNDAVTIDASDWYYNQLYLKFQENNDLESLAKLKRAYIVHILDRANYYDQLALDTIGRSPKHILLLHVRAINAAWLDELIQALKREEWEVIDIQQAYQDPIYQVRLNVLPAGESIIWNIARVYGIQGLRYPAEDAPYEQDNLKQHGLLNYQ